MTDESTKIITSYISMWGWYIVGWLLLLKCMSFLFVHFNILNGFIFFGAIGVFVLAYALFKSVKLARYIEDGC